MPDDATDKILGHKIRLNQIPDYKTAEFHEWLTAWSIWEGKGLLPFAGAWAEQPAHIIDILLAFDNAHGSFVDRETRRRKAHHDARNMRGRR